MFNVKKAALQLNSLDRRDRDWVMSRLAESQKNKLSALLSELSDIGIHDVKYNTTSQSIDDGFCSELLDANDNSYDLLSSSFKLFNSVDIGVLQRFVSSQPPDFISILLSCNALLRRNSIIDYLEKHNRKIFKSNSVITDSLRDLIIIELADELKNNVSLQKEELKAQLKRSFLYNLRMLIWRK